MSTTVHNINMTAKSTLEVCTERLDSWKEIAVYLGREVRTAQRWEKDEGLPVLRHFHVKGGTVYALKEEIDTWLTDRGQTPRESRPIQRRSRQAAKGLNVESTTASPADACCHSPLASYSRAGI